MPALFESTENANTLIDFGPLHIEVGKLSSGGVKERHPSDTPSTSSSDSSGCFSLNDNSTGASPSGEKQQTTSLFGSTQSSDALDKYWANSGFGSLEGFKSLHHF